MQLGQLTPSDQRDAPDCVTLCSAVKAGERRRKRGCLELLRLSSQVTVTYDEALLSWKWLNICLLIESSD